MIEAIVERTTRKALPVGWVQWQSRSPALLAATFYALAESLPDAVTIFVGDAPQFWPDDHWFITPIKPHTLFSALAVLLETQTFPSAAYRPPRVVLVTLFDAVGPESEKWSNHAARASWLRDQLNLIRPVIWRAGATVIAACASPNGGGAAWRSEVALRVEARPTRDGAMVIISGPAARVAPQPHAWPGRFVDSTFFEVVPWRMEREELYRAPWDGIEEPKTISSFIQPQE